MTTEQFANNATTTLNGTINASQTTLTVGNATSFPPVPQFRIIIDSEIMLVTGVSGNLYTVTRGAENTTQASHNNGVNVSMILTAGALQQFNTDNIVSGISSGVLVNTYSNRPSPGISGRLFYPTDGGPHSLDDGTNWRPIIGGIVGTQPPSASNFTWTNQGTATATDSNGCILLSSPSTAGTTRRVFSKSKPSVAFVEASFILANTGTSTGSSEIFPFTGIGLFESGTGKFAYVILVLDDNSIQSLNYLNFGTMASTTSVTSQTNVFALSTANPLFLRLSVSGGTVTAKYSNDPRSDGTTGWITIGTVAANFTTAYDSSCLVIGGEGTTTITINSSVMHYRDG